MKKFLMLLTIFSTLAISTNGYEAFAKAKNTKPYIYSVSDENNHGVGVINSKHYEYLYTDLTFTKHAKRLYKLQDQPVTVGTSYHVQKYKHGKKFQAIYQALYQNHQLIGYAWHGAIQLNKTASFNHQMAVNTIGVINIARSYNGLAPLQLDFDLEKDANNKITSIENSPVPANSDSVSYWQFSDENNYRGTSLSWILYSDISNSSDANYTKLLTDGNISKIGVSAKNTTILNGQTNQSNNYYVVIETK
ncbi:hypothetical protein AKUG0406_13730 [Apilactobacillus kunkeei]|uniref:hypothetical protein n=1 Tax=Apilactobacillus TaxID=2767877 RepID=UPI0006C1A988|nr:hypothetical protein [Apilactobacillus kunkeei]KOY70759.1 hypothetical protein RZ55_03210 [Apilactobacillus kunkeei]CAI2654717.1 hypothetical protein AKUG0406_13730 [Apilactobacillus kunkeei]CAI2658924.1 hypothetical protein AKUG0403_13720 [Apilactobacillus kunkeei]CAI2666538.1 hypothetical protein AKUG0420_13940 [Apilactobacillus kunkeei]